MKYCIHCPDLAEFVIQWGPNPDQKEYVCADDLAAAVKKIKAIEFFVVKLERYSLKCVDTDGKKEYNGIKS